MKRPKAFTLRDLVALLCLAALALPILGASVRDAAEKSVAARCRTNLAALTRCILVYTERNRGFLPVYRHASYETYVAAPPQPDRTAVAFAQSPKDPTTGLYENVMGLGLLYVQGLARPPELFYCTGRIRDERHTLANYPKPWGSRVGPGSNFIRVGYMFDPWVKQIGEYQYTYEDRLVLRRHPADWPLVCDMVMSMMHTGHIEGNSA
ncbi:MAG: hypothetical protein MUP47_01665, partial [Phycisphaerae bacterium]|nr:hypothetical protein [Phycisphaerae bacterium]